MSFAKIVLLSLAAAIAYGLVHDQITAHLCVEYFTIGHPKIIESEDPTMLALLWGVIATWWAGLIIGIPLALAARMGSWPKLTAQQLVPSVLTVLAVMALVAATWGAIMAGTANQMRYYFPALVDRVPFDKHRLFMAVWAAHAASYTVGFLGGLALSGLTFVRRRRLQRQLTNPRSPQTGSPDHP